MITSKNALIGFILTLALCMSILLSGCGNSSPSTLEEYVAANETVAQEIESYISEGMAIGVDENTLIYSYTYDSSIDDATTKIMAKQLAEAYKPMTDTFETLKSDLIKASGIEGLSIKVMYLDANDDVLYEILF